MRILILSNVSGSVDKIVDVLQNSHNVTAKEANTSMATMAGTAAEQLRKGAYDEVFVVAKDPIGAGVLLNKQEGVIAVVCGSTEDVELAQQNGANVVVIRNIDSDTIYEIVTQAAGSGGMLRSIKMPQIKIPKVLPKQQQTQQEIPAREDKRQKIVLANKARQEMEKDEEEESAHTPHDNSVVGKIKDYLGIL